MPHMIRTTVVLELNCDDCTASHEEMVIVTGISKIYSQDNPHRTAIKRAEQKGWSVGLHNGARCRLHRQGTTSQELPTVSEVQELSEISEAHEFFEDLIEAEA